ncbi:MAG TPA: hypothetical protein VM890_04455 [Longimicrobium sp.]|jgi:hypothetical protein|nr:hypothetical protein [Longimicrobium sp.]
MASGDNGAVIAVQSSGVSLTAPGAAVAGPRHDRNVVVAICVFPAVAALIGLLSNDVGILDAFTPSNWGFGNPPHYSAWSLVLLVIATCVYTYWDFNNRKAYRQAQEAALAAEAGRRLQAEETLLSRTAELQAALADLRKDRDAAKEAVQNYTQELSERTDVIEQQMRTVATPTFVPGFDEASRDSHLALLMVLRTPKRVRKREQTVQAIRYILFAAANLLKRYEGASWDTLYTANIMLYRPTGSTLTVALEQEYRSHMVAGQYFSSFADLRGVLDLSPELTASTETTLKLVPDSKIGRVVLPVPRVFSEEQQRYAFPGAPTAFCRKSMDVCPSVFELPTRCERENVVPAEYLGEFRTYFDERAAHIRSFVSIPLLSVRASDSPIGVININSEKTGLLRERPKQEAILPSLRSLLWNLPEMLEELEPRREKREVSGRPSRRKVRAP